jgi:hypothetical protein
MAAEDQPELAGEHVEPFMAFVGAHFWLAGFRT